MHLRQPNNLISIGRLTDHNYCANFTRSGVEFQTPQGQTFAEGHKVGRLYQMRAHITNPTNKPAEFATAARTWDVCTEYSVTYQLGLSKP